MSPKDRMPLPIRPCAAAATSGLPDCDAAVLASGAESAATLPSGSITAIRAPERAAAACTQRARFATDSPERMRPSDSIWAWRRFTRRSHDERIT